jgi:8-oxo-dGTP pyrophosphatase MutT (NUDIX family)
METKTNFPEIKDRELHRIVTTTIIWKKDKTGFKYLITKRAPHKKVHPNKWTVPGGGLTVDDYINEKPSTKGAPQWYGAMQKSLLRELAEEVGVRVGKPEFLVELTFIRPDGIPVIVFSYFTKFISGKVKLDDDAVEFAWPTLREAKKYDLIDGIWGELRDVEKILKSRLQK